MQVINHPFRLLVIGKSQSGKTTMAMKCLERLITQVDETYVVSPTYEYQPTWEPIRPYVTHYHDDPAAVFKAIQGAINSSFGDENHKMGTKVEKKRLLICDDVSYHRALNEGNKGILNGMAYNAVWWNLSIVCIVHKTANIGAGMKENCDGLIILNVIPKELKPIFETFGMACKNQRQFNDLMHQFISKKIESGEDKHPFLFFDLKSGGLLYYKMQEKLEFTE